jgi:hypothetical protein
MYQHGDDGLVWREAAPEANAHVEVAVSDAADGRFIPQLKVHLDAWDGDRNVLCGDMPFLWHPFLHHYGANAMLPGHGPYDVTVHIEPPGFMRHDPINGRRYAEPVTARFERVQFKLGRKESPNARPRGTDAPTTGTGHHDA